MAVANAPYNSLLSVLARDRPRSSWNERFAHWERPASNSEEQQIERAAAMVRTALSGSSWLTTEGVTIAPQGSYLNNTNVRLEADMDLRAVHPLIKIEYAAGVVVDCAQAVHGIPQSGRYFEHVIEDMRREISASLIEKFGAHQIDVSGNKAIRLQKLPGSRADLDVVPAFRHYWMWWDTQNSRYMYNEGISILSRNGTWTNNFPQQHYANGIAKRTRTAHRFKRNTRILKHLRDELVQDRVLRGNQVPSFLIESLTYAVEDAYFLQEQDDRYDRARRILYRIGELLSNRNG